MTTKGFIVLFFMVIAIGLFSIVGFDIVQAKTYNFVALGLASQGIAVLVNWFMPGGVTP